MEITTVSGSGDECGVGVGVVAVWDGRREDEAGWDRGVGAEVVGGLAAVFGIWGYPGGGAQLRKGAAA